MAADGYYGRSMGRCDGAVQQSRMAGTKPLPGPTNRKASLLTGHKKKGAEPQKTLPPTIVAPMGRLRKGGKAAKKG